MRFYPIDVWWEEAEDENYIRFGDMDERSIFQSMVYRWRNSDDLNPPYNPNYYHIVLLF